MGSYRGFVPAGSTSQGGEPVPKFRTAQRDHGGARIRHGRVGGGDGLRSAGPAGRDSEVVPGGHRRLRRSLRAARQASGPLSETTFVEGVQRSAQRSGGPETRSYDREL